MPLSFTDSELMTPEQVSDLLGIKVTTLQIWRSTGRYQLPYCKVGRYIRYRTQDVQQFIANRMHNHTGDAAA